jgi:hypothetical protein
MKARLAFVFLLVAAFSFADPFGTLGQVGGWGEITYVWQADAGAPVFSAPAGFLTMGADHTFLADPMRSPCESLSPCEPGYCSGSWDLASDGQLTLTVRSSPTPVVARYHFDRQESRILLTSVEVPGAKVSLQPPL